RTSGAPGAQPTGRSDDVVPAPPPAERTDDVVLHPGAASGSRRWPLDGWVQVAQRLVERGVPVVLTGGPDEDVPCDAVVRSVERAVAGRGDVTGTVRSTAGTLDLPQLAEVVARARLVVCGDTGVAHVATAFGTPSVLLFGPTPPRWWGPAIDRDRHTVLWRGDDAYRGDPHAADVDPALAAITPDEVLAAAATHLAP
ncbi:glycosyltransferase family 9 protein, partial [Actinotalea ferrariae]|uniref:glycosyltransferase family 9 protein n=1 Tax=Actinotalea ferrariae TaxID=1386098 RepID=UPI001C8C9FAD